MKNLELKELGVQEMNTAEMTNVNGGGLGDILININLQPVFNFLSGVLNDTGSFLTKQLGSLFQLLSGGL
jgi:hypothetical protein